MLSLFSYKCIYIVLRYYLCAIMWYLYIIIYYFKNSKNRPNKIHEIFGVPLALRRALCTFITRRHRGLPCSAWKNNDLKLKWSFLFVFLWLQFWCAYIMRHCASIMRHFSHHILSIFYVYHTRAIIYERSIRNFEL